MPFQAATEAAQTAPDTRRVTFADVVAGYLTLHASGWTGGIDGPEAKTYRRQLVAGRLGPLWVDGITSADVERALKPWGDKPTTADKVRLRISGVMDYATAKGFRTGDNPARRSVFKHLLKPVPKSKPQPAMPSADVPKFMAELIGDGSTETRALALLFHTATRSNEILGLQWRDIKKGLWVCPASKMKEKVEHVVPLSREALTIIGEPGDPDAFVFGSRSTGDTKPLWMSSMREVLKAARGRTYSVHGFRSTFVDWAARASYSSELREMALAHAVGDATFQAYNRDKLLEQRREMMETWSSFCANGS